MKRLLVLLLILGNSMLFATSILNIRAKEYYESVCRLVFDVDRDTDFLVEETTDGFYIGIPGFDGKIPRHDLSKTFLSSLEPEKGGLMVSSAEELGFYTMRLSASKSLVIDFYKKSTDKAARLAIARFNSDKGRWVAADKDFSRLVVDYPNHWDLWYYWAELLVKRESSRAQEKLAKIPPESSYYARAQALLGADQAEQEPSIETEPDLPLAAEPVKPAQDSVVYDFPVEAQAPAAPLPHTSEKAAWNYPLLFVISFAFILLIVVLYLIFRKKRQKVGNWQSGIQESSLSMDTATISRMVNRLLADGWTNKEIARELKISLQEVDQIIRRLHFTGGIDDEDKI
jgi:hypothetical protein